MRSQPFRALIVALVATGCDAGSPAGPSLPDAEPAIDAGAEASADATLDSAPDSPGDADGPPGYAVCPDGMVATFDSIYTEMLSTVAYCGAKGFGCHSTISASQTGSKLDLSLDASAVYEELLGPDGGGYPATNIGGDAGRAVLRVVPGDAGASMLYIKLTLKTSNDPRYGGGMPNFAPGSICPPALDAVKQWIADGAAP
jgi:hypothetical protein